MAERLPRHADLPIYSRHELFTPTLYTTTTTATTTMTRTTHKAHPTPSFPVYCLDWADDETLILGGGGGASRSGISNMLVRISVK